MFAKRSIHGIVLACLVTAPATVAMAYEAIYEKTPVGDIEVKVLPTSRVLESRSDQDYFSADNNLFRRLFRFIQKNDVAMTVPVEAEASPGAMRFFVGSEDSRALASESGGVTVKTVAERQVVSVGLRGSYSEERYQKGIAMLRSWLDEHPEWAATGEPYAVYWNGPAMPWFLKRSEVHIPVDHVKP